MENNKYQLALKKYNQISKMNNDILSKLDEDIREILHTFKNDSGNSMVTYESLANLEFNVWFPVGNGVKFKRIEHSTKPVYYITEMDPSQTIDGIAKLGIQIHDCREYCNVIEGELIEPFEGDKKYTTGDVVIYPTNYKHKPYSTIFSRYGVEFIDPNEDNNINNKTKALS